MALNDCIVIELAWVQLPGISHKLTVPVRSEPEHSDIMSGSVKGACWHSKLSKSGQHRSANLAEDSRRVNIRVKTNQIGYAMGY